MRAPAIVPFLILCLSGCSPEALPRTTQLDGSVSGSPSVESPSPVEAARTNAPALSSAPYLGRWTGVEGMYLVVADAPSGGVSLEMQYDLDTKGRFDGAITERGLQFTRDGKVETARRTDGDATGLKYLAGKTDCLTVKPGEGYCR